MHRRVVLLLALVACEAPAPPAEPAPPRWVYAPPPPAWPLGSVSGRIGRSPAPQLTAPAGITGDVRFPLRLATPWTVPGTGPARAAIYGLEGVRPAIEVIDIDAGRVLWRSTEVCVGPIVGVTEEAIVCADVHGTRGVKLDGKSPWHAEQPFIAMTDERVVVGDEGMSIVLDAATGDELARMPLPRGVAPDGIIASCGDAGHELFSTGQDGKLVRMAEGKGGEVVSWATPVGAIDQIDACDGDSVLVTSGTSLVAFARATGKITGRVEGVRGWWPGRVAADRIELATAAGVESWPRDLTGDARALPLPPLGELLARRGDRRLVRASPWTAVLLDAAGVHAYIPFAAMGAALGDTAVLGSSWTGSQAESVHRFGLPPRYMRPLRLPLRAGGVMVPAELRDLPAVKPLDVGAAIAKPDTGMHAASAVAVDPTNTAVLYTVQLEKQADDTGNASVASIDLAKRAWKWQRSDGCGAGAPVALAVARDVVVCGAHAAQPGTASVRATSLDGAARWKWDGEAVDAIEAAGDLVVVHAAERAFVLDAATGKLRASFASDDGAAMRIAPILAGDRTLLVSYERGRLVARAPEVAFVPVWSLAVDGVVTAVSPSQDGILVELEDGDALRVTATGDAITLPGIGLEWSAQGELVTGATPGGPIYEAPRIVAPPIVRRSPQGRPLAPPDPEAPPLATPVPPPPVLGAAWQYTLYELGGGLRVRNDYGITAPVVPALARARGPAGSPLVALHGAAMHDVLVVDPRTGDPVKQIVLPEDAPPGVVFSTIVDGTPVAGAVLASPLRIVLF